MDVKDVSVTEARMVAKESRDGEELEDSRVHKGQSDLKETLA